MTKCNPILELKGYQDSLREAFVTANEIKRRFPNASENFIRINSSSARGLQGAQPKPSFGISAEVEAKRKKDGPSRCQVRISSMRRRLIDPDNLFVKPIIDALRYEGIISDDSAAHIVLVVNQEKVKLKDDECTLIEIER